MISEETGGSPPFLHVTKEGIMTGKPTKISTNKVVKHHEKRVTPSRDHNPAKGEMTLYSNYRPALIAGEYKIRIAVPPDPAKQGE